MSTEQPAHDSDSEDEDYIPPLESSESSDKEPDSKPQRTPSPQPQNQDEAEKKRARDALWSTFQVSVSSTTPVKPAPPKEMIKIEKRYKFAGETVVEVVEVTADSPDAKKWPQWPPDETPREAPPSTPEVAAKLREPSSSAKPPVKRPGPRRSKVSLAAIPTASSQKAKKLSTLDKSAMDWHAHVQSSESSGLKDELEANRRGGGYLEKVEFLNRVEKRTEDVIEATASCTCSLLMDPLDHWNILKVSDIDLQLAWHRKYEGKDSKIPKAKLLPQKKEKLRALIEAVQRLNSAAEEGAAVSSHVQEPDNENESKDEAAMEDNLDEDWEMDKD
ncbi:hypothetical protein DXG03_003823 [Asterophora parasitica]|uniref:SWR1-complex protein 5 n=1 Tax=Asterophora parasitica TaxID=117018 RepID=A0A9P7G165_9AGAR|nr:hypothetical protein DXG03_003823 [Asterophora parasitica]